MAAILGLDNVQALAILGTLVVFGVVLELVRRRRLVERYALLWLVTSAALLVLAIWRDLLGIIADAAGIALPSNALFIAAIGVAFLLLLHFSVAISRLSEETKILAQEVARLDHQLHAERALRAAVEKASAVGAEQPQDDAPVSVEQPPQRR